MKTFILTILIVNAVLTCSYFTREDEFMERRKRDNYIIENSFIVHLKHEEISPNSFIDKVRGHLHNRKLSHLHVEIEPIEHLFQGVTIKGLSREELELLPHIDKIIPDTVRKIKTIASFHNSPVFKSSSTTSHNEYDNTISIHTTSTATVTTTARALSIAVAVAEEEDTSSSSTSSSSVLTLPWGVDRVDQNTLPLDASYNSYYNGSNVDVYVVDTGLDTRHQEFKPRIGSTRIVKNVYDTYLSNKLSPGPDIDDVGHGTHVAGTIGGNTIGVSPEANIYGVKILNSDGSGGAGGIVKALDYIYKVSKNSHRRTVVSMSLGGPCDDDDCTKDVVVLAVEVLSSHGIIVSVAAGNEGCNACYGSPNSAPHAVVVGASDENDKITFYSNFGQCVDVIAPGANIRSACAKSVCNDDSSYIEYSGTSMACPHVSGMIAQILQKLDGLYRKSDGSLIPITSDKILNELSCSAVKGVVTVDKRDTITKGILLHTPSTIRQDDKLIDMASGTCMYTSNCPADCSKHGTCLISRPLAMPILFSNPNQTHQIMSPGPNCYCDKGYYGNTCATNVDPMCSIDGHVIVQMYMLDTFGDGWTFTNYAITNQYGLVSSNAYDSLCYGNIGSRKYCLPPGVYDLTVTRGFYPNEVAWSICGIQGSAPSYIQLNIINNRCLPGCPSGSYIVQYNLFDSYGDGWNGAYYSLHSETTGVQVYGGTMVDGKTTSHTMCLQQGCYILIFEKNGLQPDEISYNICGYESGDLDILRVCIDDDHNCSVEIYGQAEKPHKSSGSISPTPSSPQSPLTGNNTYSPTFSPTDAPTSVPTASTCGADSSIPFYLFDPSLNSWTDMKMILNPIDTKTLSYSTLINNTEDETAPPLVSYHYHIPKGTDIITSNSLILQVNTDDDGIDLHQFDILQHTCIPDGCYTLAVIPQHGNYSIPNSRKDYSSLVAPLPQFWYACSYFGHIPKFTQICVEQKYDLCYGLEGCLYVKSYAHVSQHQLYFITGTHPILKSEKLIHNGNIHGVNTLCSLPDGTFNIYVGGGKSYSTTDERNYVWICGQSIMMPYTGQITISNNMTSCSTTVYDRPPKTIDTTCINPYHLNTSPNSITPSPNSTKSIPILMIKVDLFGDGWGKGSKYIITKLYTDSSSSSTTDDTSINNTPDIFGDDVFYGQLPGISVSDDDQSYGGGPPIKNDNPYQANIHESLSSEIYEKDNVYLHIQEEYITTSRIQKDPHYKEKFKFLLNQYKVQKSENPFSPNSVKDNQFGEEVNKFDGNRELEEDNSTTNTNEEEEYIFDGYYEDIPDDLKYIDSSLSTIKVTTEVDNTPHHHHHYQQHSRQLLNTPSNIVATGTLSDGEIGYDTFCLDIGKCYSIDIISTSHPDEILWVMCGYMGDYTAKKLEFCVTDTGCEFTTVTDPSYINMYDDDFPNTPHIYPTKSPSYTSHPTKQSPGGLNKRYTRSPVVSNSDSNKDHTNATAMNNFSKLNHMLLYAIIVLLIIIVLISIACMTNFMKITDNFCLLLGYRRMTVRYSQVQGNENDDVGGPNNTISPIHQQGGGGSSTHSKSQHGSHNKRNVNEFQIMEDDDDDEGEIHFTKKSTV